MENQSFTRELQPGMEDEMVALASPENPGIQSSEIAPLQLEGRNSGEKPAKGMQDGLKIIITASICFAISVTIALILTIYLGPPQVVPHAAVVSDSKLCASTGEHLLRRGGSAVDAAIAVVLCEGLVNPHHSGIGGGGFMVVRRSRENKTSVIDFMDAAPMIYSPATVPTTSKRGLMVGVPGMLKGLEKAHQMFGKLRWIDVIMSVVELAYSPVNVSSELSDYIDGSDSPDIVAYFAKIRKLTPNGNQMNVTRLGWLLQNVAKNGADAFYTDYKDEILKAISNNSGTMTEEDLKSYTAVVREPVRSTFHNMAVESVPSPGGGPLLLLFLNIMENLTADASTLWNSTDVYHYIVEALKFTYGHQTVLDDSDFARNNATALLISKAYAAELASRVDADKTLDTGSYSPGAAFHPGHGTTQISVIDSNDDMVSLTVSLNGLFGSGLVTESGIILNSHMLNFNSEDENSNNGGKRPLVTLSPTVIYNPTKPCGKRFALGGGNGNSTLAGLGEVVLNILAQNMPLSQAIISPRLDVRFVSGGDEIYYEAQMPSTVLQQLKEKQHGQLLNSTSDIGIVHVVAKINETIVGVADFRSDGEAVIY